MTLDQVIDKLLAIKAEDNKAGSYIVMQEGDTRYFTTDIAIVEDRKGNRIVVFE